MKVGKLWSFFLAVVICFFAVSYSYAAKNITKSGTNIIDEESSSFEKGCDSGNWWWDESVGHGGHMFWTYAIDDPTDGHYGCYGKWNMNIMDSGNYEVLVHIPSNYATSKKAEYKIWRTVAYDDYESSYRTIDQSIYSDEWVSLGTYYFYKGAAAIRLDDYTGESYTYLKRKLGYDAVRLVNADPYPPSNQKPTVDITSCPSGTLTSASYKFRWDGADEDGTISKYYYELDDPTPDYSTGYEYKRYSDLENGWHTFYVKARDNDDAYSEVDSCRFYVDIPETNKPPAVEITNCPSDTLTNSSYTFGWRGADEDGSIEGFYYGLNDSTPNNWTNSTSQRFTNLSNDTHRLYLKAKDNDGGYSDVISCTFNVNVQENPPESDVPLYGQRGEYWSGDRLGTCYPETIGSHGCAISSIAMVFKYYGVNIDPRDLNNWLKGNNGYDAGCQVKWDVAANRTGGQVQWVERINYRSVPADLDRIKSELDNGYPVIAEMCNDVGPLKPYYHFIVITGYSGSSFYINDPWFNESNTISARYGDPARAICGIRVYHGEADTSNIALTKGIWVFENDPNTYPIEYGQWLDAQFTVKNYGNEAITFKRIAIGGRAPSSNGGNPDPSNVYDLGFETNVTLQPNEQKQLWFHTDNFGKNNIWGKYRLTAFYQLTDESWHEIPPGESDTGTSYEFQVVRHSSSSSLSYGVGKNAYVPRGGYDHFYIDVPSDASELKIVITGARSGNYIDLYEQSGSSYPTTSSYDNKSDMTSSDETITVNNPSFGRHAILVYGNYDDGDPEKGTPYRIVASYDETETPPPPETETISKPGTPAGETSPIIGTNCHYQSSGSSSSLGHEIEYKFNWGDGTGSGWSMAKHADHTWQNSDNGISRSVTVEARCKRHPDKSNTSRNLVVIPVTEPEEPPPADEDITITKVSPSLVTVGTGKKDIRDSWFDLIIEGTSFSSGINLGVYIPGVCLGDKNSGDCDNKAVLISDTKLKVTVKEVYGSSLEGYRYVGIIDLNASADNNELARNERIFSAVDPKKVAILKRTSIGGQIGETVTWNVDFKDEYNSEFGIGSDGTIFELIIRNLKKSTHRDSSPKVLTSSVTEHRFNDTGVHAVKLRATNDRGIVETPEILQLVAPDATVESWEYSFNESECDPDKQYDVIVVGGTSAGIGAAITAASEKLSVCLLERTDLLGGMFTNGIGNTDLGLNKFNQRYLSYGLMEKLRQKVIDGYKEDEKEKLDYGLRYRPSTVRKALYELLKEVDLDIQLKASFKGVVRNVSLFEVTVEGKEKPYKSRYIIDATDSGDVAVDYAKNLDLNKFCSDNCSDSVYGELNRFCSKCSDSVNYSDSVYAVRNPTQAYSYVLTVQDYESPSHWSHMETPPPHYGLEGEYTDKSIKKSWTWNSGYLCGDKEEPKKYQVKHHVKLCEGSIAPCMYSKDGREYPVLGDELIDSTAPLGLDVIAAYSVRSEDERYYVRERYLDHTLSFLYKMQQIDSGIGLTEDEDPLRGNFPARIYVREGRRIYGKEIFTERDAFKKLPENPEDDGSGLFIRPQQTRDKTRQGIGVVAYTMDSHATDPYADPTGKHTWNEMVKRTGPGVIPLGVMIPNNLPNLLVALAVSSTPEGYSTLRMDPTRMNMGQAAALAISVAKEKGIKVATLVDEEKANVLFEMQKRLVRDYGGRIFLYRDKELDPHEPSYNSYLDMATQFLGIWKVAQGYYDHGSGKCIGNEVCSDDNGYKFFPNNPVNRVEFITMLVKLARFAKKKEELNAVRPMGERYIPGVTFGDVEADSWYEDFVSEAYNAKIISGTVENGVRKFKPGQNLKRCEAAVMVMNAFGQSFNCYKPPAPGFSDVSERDEKGNKVWYYDGVACAKENGIMNGYSPLKFGPGDDLKRGHAAMVLFNAYERYIGNE